MKVLRDQQDELLPDDEPPRQGMEGGKRPSSSSQKPPKRQKVTQSHRPLAPVADFLPETRPLLGDESWAVVPAAAPSAPNGLRSQLSARNPHTQTFGIPNTAMYMQPEAAAFTIADIPTSGVSHLPISEHDAGVGFPGSNVGYNNLNMPGLENWAQGSMVDSDGGGSSTDHLQYHPNWTDGNDGILAFNPMCGHAFGGSQNQPPRD